MKRWFLAFLVALGSGVWVVLHRSSDANLLQDSDTAFLLKVIRERQAPFSWFAGDWPLGNHFYRPIATLLFEFDNRLYHNAAWGYGLTNALLCAFCTLLLFWFLREFIDKPWIAAVSTAVFAGWETGTTFGLGALLPYVALGVGIGGILRHGIQNLGRWLPASLILYELSVQITSAEPIMSTTITWLPGRTAPAMTVFVLAALACYARYERLGAARRPVPRTPLDPPATRSSAAPTSSSGGHIVWPILAIVSVAGAMATYEQGVMTPGLLLAVACTFAWRGHRVRWGWQAAFWSLLVGYLALRHVVVPSDPSRYQLQQFRTGPGVWITIAAYAFPSLFSVVGSTNWIEGLPISLLGWEPWQTLIFLASDVTTFVKSRTRWQWTFAGYGMALLAFLPMAWFKQFGHYHYLPLALKSLLVTMLGWLAFDLTVSAWSPQTQQAPARLRPAPGSLPRP